jgi:hypothetical protein
MNFPTLLILPCRFHAAGSENFVGGRGLGADGFGGGDEQEMVGRILYAFALGLKRPRDLAGPSPLARYHARSIVLPKISPPRPQLENPSGTILKALQTFPRRRAAFHGAADSGAVPGES